jgi:hypothetical protein
MPRRVLQLQQARTTLALLPPSASGGSWSTVMRLNFQSLLHQWQGASSAVPWSKNQMRFLSPLRQPDFRLRELGSTEHLTLADKSNVDAHYSSTPTSLPFVAPKAGQIFASMSLAN